MKKMDSFFLTILFMVIGLSAFFYSAYGALTTIDKDLQLLTKIERQKALLKLSQKIQQLDAQKLVEGGRGIASIPPSGTSAVMDEMEFVVDTPLDTEKYAKEYYLRAKSVCYKHSEDKTCLKEIEKVIVHFPETLWAGETLILLTDYYYQNNQLAKARDIVGILKEQFKSANAIQKKVALIERHLK